MLRCDDLCYSSCAVVYCMCYAALCSIKFRAKLFREILEIEYEKESYKLKMLDQLQVEEILASLLALIGCTIVFSRLISFTVLKQHFCYISEIFAPRLPLRSCSTSALRYL